MHFEPNNIYHVYNKGNNKNRIFFNPDNYWFLLNKIKTEWLPFCDIFSYCLMPTHFHFMLYPNTTGCQNIILKEKPSHLQELSKAIGKTLSSYTRAINKRYKTTGNLFQKKTKAKCLSETLNDKRNPKINSYALTCFNYIHFNPVAARLVDNPGKWPYSSWPDYYHARKRSVCNIKMAIEKIGLTSQDLNPYSEIKFDSKMIGFLW